MSLLPPISYSHWNLNPSIFFSPVSSVSSLAFSHQQTVILVAI
jgi:hypothetical protein